MKRFLLSTLGLILGIFLGFFPWHYLCLKATAPLEQLSYPSFNVNQEVGYVSFNKSKSTFFCYPIASSINWFVNALPNNRFPSNALTSNKPITKNFIIPTLGFYVEWQGSTLLHHCVPTTEEATASMVVQRLAA